MLTSYSMKKADRNYLKFLEKKHQIITEVKEILNNLAADLLSKFSMVTNLRAYAQCQQAHY